MLRYVYDQAEAVAQATAQLIPRCRARGFGKCAAIGVIDGQGRLIAGLIYHNYDPDAGTIELSAGSIDPRWLSRETLARMYQFPFGQLGCQMVYVHVDPDDMRTQRVLAGMGYAFTRLPRMLGRNKDVVFGQLTVEAWEDGKFMRRWRSLAADQARKAA